MSCRITSFEELVEILCAAKLISDYEISDGLMDYVRRKEYPDYICKIDLMEYYIVTGETKRVKEITVGKLSLIGQILKKEEFIGDL